jgi:hypothetical protein
MRTPLRLLLPLPLLLALCACAGAPAKPVPVTVQCPQLPPVPASLLEDPPEPLHTAQKLQSLLFVPSSSATTQTPASRSSVSR